MADPYEYTPDRYVERQKAIERWKRRQDDFPEGRYAVEPLVYQGVEFHPDMPTTENTVFIVPYRRYYRFDDWAATILKRVTWLR
jgi:hypothetical protein